MNLAERCRARIAGRGLRVVLPEAHDPRVLQAYLGADFVPAPAEEPALAGGAA